MSRTKGTKEVKKEVSKDEVGVKVQSLKVFHQGESWFYIISKGREIQQAVKTQSTAFKSFKDAMQSALQHA